MKGSHHPDAVRHQRDVARMEGLGRRGFIIVAVAALILSLNQTVKIMVTAPLAEWLSDFLESLALNVVVGVAILLAAVWARRRYPAPGRSQYARAFVAVAAAAAVVLLAIEMADSVLGGAPEDWSVRQVMLGVGTELARYAFVGMVITGAWLYARTDAEHAAAIAQCAVDSARMDEQTAEARLQMLEAQIEPHFLFNTLAHVARLYQTDRESGARMLRNLEAYLAVALPQMRASQSTLGRELGHALAYLEIQQIRMGRRLTYAIDVDDRLRDAQVPPLMLVTLVENAIKHGLTPVPAGGRIDIRARVEGDRLRIEVVDTGQGFTKSGGGGTGLANIRARLAAQFGDEAKLALALNSPQGVVATIALPYRSSAANPLPA